MQGVVPKYLAEKDRLKNCAVPLLKRAQRCAQARCSGRTVRAQNRSAIGGNVSRNPRMSRMNATALICVSATFRLRQRVCRTAHTVSQSTMALVVTPESGPVGFQKIIAFPNAADLSPRMARAARRNAPMPTARITAAPAHLGRAEETEKFANACIVSSAEGKGPALIELRDPLNAPGEG